MQKQSPSNRRMCLWMVLAALALRLAVVAFLYPERLDPDRDHWHFAGETGRIARSLAEGEGFSNPLFGQTGPTAMIPPVYPYILAAVFDIFGVYTKSSAIGMLSLNSLFSALTCLPVFFLARISLGDGPAAWAGWTWVFFPYAVYFSADLIWPTILACLLLSVLLLCVLLLEASSQPWYDFWFGILSGVAALTEPVVLSVLPPLTAWMYYRRQRRGLQWRAPASAMALGFVLVVAPWFIRNYQTFHTFIPFRDGFGLQLHIGNNGDSSHFIPPGYQPSLNEGEMREFRRLGELAYMTRKQEQAVGFIASHPAWFLGVTLRRILYMWTSYWSFDPHFLAQEPFNLPDIFLSTVMDLLALAGLYRAFRMGSRAAIPFALVLLFFPMVYYVTVWQDYYRRPIDPVFVVLASYEVWSRFQRGRERFPQAQEISASVAGGWRRVSQGTVGQDNSPGREPHREVC